MLHGRWKKIDAGYGRAVLGYFGRPPLEPDEDVVRAASEQLKLPRFDGDPLDAAPDSLAEARAALESRHLPATDENVFLVAAAIVPGKNIELNEGLRLLTGKAKISLPLKGEETARAQPHRRGPRPAVVPGVSSAAATGDDGPSCDVLDARDHVVHGRRGRHHAPLQNHDRAAQRLRRVWQRPGRASRRSAHRPSERARRRPRCSRPCSRPSRARPNWWRSV